MPLCYHISENFSGVITTKKGQLKGGIFLILAAVIWGLSFVAQSEGLEVIGTLTFNGIRMIMGGTVLLPVIAIMSGVQKSKNKKLGSTEQKTPEEKKKDKKKSTLSAGLSAERFSACRAIFSRRRSAIQRSARSAS